MIAVAVLKPVEDGFCHEQIDDMSTRSIIGEMERPSSSSVISCSLVLMFYINLDIQLSKWRHIVISFRPTALDVSSQPSHSFLVCNPNPKDIETKSDLFEPAQH